MAEYWPSQFIFTLFMDRNGVEAHKQAKKKKNQANIQPSWPDNLFYGFQTH